MFTNRPSSVAGTLAVVDHRSSLRKLSTFGIQRLTCSDCAEGFVCERKVFRSIWWKCSAFQSPSDADVFSAHILLKSSTRILSFSDDFPVIQMVRRETVTTGQRESACGTAQLPGNLEDTQLDLRVRPEWSP